MKLLIVIASILGFASDSFAQPIPACPSQRSLEQVTGSNGRFVPDDCRQLSITAVTGAGGRLCVLDFKAGTDPGVLDRLADATVPTQWWVECDGLKVR